MRPSGYHDARLDGYDTCAALKADSENGAIPVILISATTDVRVVDRAEAWVPSLAPQPFRSSSWRTRALALNPPARRVHKATRAGRFRWSAGTTA